MEKKRPYNLKMKKENFLNLRNECLISTWMSSEFSNLYEDHGQLYQEDIKNGTRI